MTDKKDYPLTVITWEDSRQQEVGWQWLEDYTPKEVCKCTTVGYLIHDDDKVKVLAQSMADDDQISGVTHIPTCCVTKLTKL